MTDKSPGFKVCLKTLQMAANKGYGCTFSLIGNAHTLLLISILIQQGNWRMPKLHLYTPNTKYSGGNRERGMSCDVYSLDKYIWLPIKMVTSRLNTFLRKPGLKISLTFYLPSAGWSSELEHWKGHMISSWRFIGWNVGWTGGCGKEGHCCQQPAIWK